ncbi:MAG: hypothetical protein QM749_15745 [Aquabacterium sp.]
MALHPLTRPAAWPLNVGAVSVPAIKWAGAALWLAAALAALVWLIGLVQDAFAGQLSAWMGAAGTLAIMAWFALAWQVARRWLMQSGTLTLTWRGPVRAPDPTRDKEDKPEGGFHVNEWQSAVQVHVVCDWQRWVLLRLRATSVKGQGRQAFCWVAMPGEAPQVARANASLHQLRTLLYLPAAWITQEGDQPSLPTGQARHAAKPVASWAALLSSGSKLPLPDKRRSPAVSREADTLFPQTELLDEADAREHVLPKGLA